MERKKKKHVTFSQEAPLIKHYSNDFSADRKANSQTPQEYYSAKQDRKKEKQQLQKEEYHNNIANIANDYRFAYWWSGGRKSKKRKSRKSIRKTRKNKK